MHQGHFAFKIPGLVLPFIIHCVFISKVKFSSFHGSEILILEFLVKIYTSLFVEFVTNFRSYFLVTTTYLVH